MVNKVPKGFWFTLTSFGDCCGMNLYVFLSVTKIMLFSGFSKFPGDFFSLFFSSLEFGVSQAAVAGLHHHPDKGYGVLLPVDVSRFQTVAQSGELGGDGVDHLLGSVAAGNQLEAAVDAAGHADSG